MVGGLCNVLGFVCRGNRQHRHPLSSFRVCSLPLITPDVFYTVRTNVKRPVEISEDPLRTRVPCLLSIRDI